MYCDISGVTSTDVWSCTCSLVAILLTSKVAKLFALVREANSQQKEQEEKWARPQ